MKNTLKFIIILMIGLVAVGCVKPEDPHVEPKTTVTTTKVVTYDGPSIMTSSEEVDVKVNGESLFVYQTRVNHGRVFTFSSANMGMVPLVIFDFEGKVTVAVEIKGVTITEAKVTPQAYNVTPTINGSTITFDLEYPTSYTVEYNNQTEKVVHIFANPLEEDVPDPTNLPEDMIYIGPGVYKSDAIPVQSNTTLYIAGGAVVFGQIRAGAVDNVTIRGRGIISGEIYPRTKASEFTIPFEFQHSTNISLEGLTFLDPAGWAINAYFIDGLEIDNIKIVTARGNGDGISLQSCKNAVVKNSFVRSWDDSLVVKNYSRGTTENIRFENMILWTDLAQSMEIGYETYGETIDNVVFNNITILHNFHKPALSIHNADDARITNIVFSNITIEDAQMKGDNAKETYDDFLIDFQILYNLEWTKSGQNRGTISNVTVNNLLVLDGHEDLNTKIAGFDSQHKVSNVKFQNITLFGKKVTKAVDLKASVNQFTDNISYSFNMQKSTGADVYYPYELDLEDNQVEMTKKPNITQVGLIVPDFSIGEVSQAYMGVEVTGSFTVTSFHGISSTVWDDGTGSNEVEGFEVQNVLDSDLSKFWKSKPWNHVNDEYATVNIVFESNKTIGTIRIYGNPDSKIYLIQNIAIYGIKASSTTDRYLKVTNSDNYEFSPANGNFVDIKINPDQFKALQVRIYNKQGMAYPEEAFIHRVQFFPASLSFGKAVTGTEHEDVYNINNLTDGIPTTYYEGKKGVFPAEIIINLGDSYQIKYINLHLPPLMQWESRTQVISFYTSTDGVNYSLIIANKSCLFDPLTGNVVEIILDQPVACQYLKLIVSSNTASGGEGAQLSEISVYE